LRPMALNGISGTVAVVTGAASGIGESTARRLSEEGASVVAVDWSADAVEGLVLALAGPAAAVHADVSLEEDVERYTVAALERFGRVDLVHLNAGIAGTFAPFDEIEASDFDRVIAVNLRSVFLGLRAALRQLRAQRRGRDRHDLLARRSPRRQHDHPVHRRQARRRRADEGGRLARDSVRHPRELDRSGVIVTGLMRHLEDMAGSAEALREAIEPVIPMHRYGSSAEAVGLVAYLLSDDASYLTGAVIPIDGGVHASNPLTR
jgi:NAD(P)-dependent dehydrogenase (short-subunit alcohol dehydrogenase family)